MLIIIFICGNLIGLIINIIINAINFELKLKQNNKINTRKRLKSLKTIKIKRNSISQYLKEASILKLNKVSILVNCITFTILLVSYFKLGLNLILLKGIVLISILIVVAFVDLKNRIIPNFLVVICLVLGILFYFSGDTSLASMLLGMITGGGILFILALLPGAIGGGDIKLMFAVGAYLGFENILWALFSAFILAAVISILLLVFKIKERKDFIPLGPFLAIGSGLVFIFFR